MDGGWAVLMVITMVLIWALLVLAIVWLVRATRTPQPPTPPPGGPVGSAGPEQILAERLARGEIDPEDYRARLTALTSAR
jgi:putative membrane protein